jgi:hypothetical protein
MKWLFTAKDVLRKEVRLINENSEEKTFTIKYECDDVDDDKELYQYFADVFDFHNTKDSSELNRPGDDLLISVKLEEILKPEDFPQPQQYKEYDNVWPISISWGDLDHSNSELLEIEITWKYDEVKYGHYDYVVTKELPDKITSKAPVPSTLSTPMPPITPIETESIEYPEIYNFKTPQKWKLTMSDGKVLEDIPIPEPPDFPEIDIPDIDFELPDIELPPIVIPPCGTITPKEEE